MRSARHALLICAVAGLAAATTVARAEPLRTGPTEDSYVARGDFAFQSNVGGPEARNRTLEWDARKGRWGLKLDVEQHADGMRSWDDVAPGVFFKVTPRLHIGGAVSLAPGQIEQPVAAVPAQSPPPRVRLETTFKF